MHSDAAGLLLLLLLLLSSSRLLPGGPAVLSQDCLSPCHKLLLLLPQPLHGRQLQMALIHPSPH
jgi:hypothetical protein